MIFNLTSLFITIDIKNIFLILLAPFYLSLGLVIYIKNRENTFNKLFFLVLLTVVLWTISMIFYRGAKDINSTLLWVRLLYTFATLIPITFLYFSINLKYQYLPKGPNLHLTTIKLISLFLLIPFLAIFYISITPNYLIKNVLIIPGQEKIIIFNNTLHLVYALYIISYFTVAFLIIFDTLKKISGLSKVQLFYLFISTLLSAIIGIGSNLILPLLGIFTFNWLGQIGVLTLVILISYSILEYQLFNIKVILTEVLVLSLIILLIGRILISFLYNNINDLILNSVSLILTSIFGFYLIKSIKKEIEQKEKLEQLNRIKSEFLSFASHQVKAPMAVAKGYAELIMDGIENVPDQAKDFAKKIKEAVDNLLVLVEEFMDYRRIDEGRMEYNFENVELISLIKEIFDKFSLVAQEKGLEYKFETKIEKAFVKIDKVRFSQVIQNLIDNALKYTKQGFVKVDIWKEGKDFILCVSDSGIGMSKELQSKLFGEFVRDPSIKKEIKGTGLGLYIAKNIIEAHQGKIWAESEGEGKGSKFYVKLPLLENSDNQKLEN